MFIPLGLTNDEFFSLDIAGKTKAGRIFIRNNEDYAGRILDARRAYWITMLGTTGRVYKWGKSADGKPDAEKLQEIADETGEIPITYTRTD